jgi:hypothetical protein
MLTYADVYADIFWHIRSMEAYYQYLSIPYALTYADVC